VLIPSDESDLDGLNYLAGKSLAYVNEKAFLGTLEAHVKTGEVNNILLSVSEITPGPSDTSFISLSGPVRCRPIF
jgi:glucose-6-phosphate isomerase